MRISVNDIFERRIGIFPAGFDDDGVLFCNQNFADYPFRRPRWPFDPWRAASPEWMLLSYRARLTQPRRRRIATAAYLAVTRTSAPGGRRAAQASANGFGRPRGDRLAVSAIQVNLADHALAEIAPRLDEGADRVTRGAGIYPTP